MLTYYASPTGSGNGLSLGTPGSLATVKTLAAAANDNVTVYLLGGEYAATNFPLSFTSSDSGKAGYKVLWVAYPGNLPIFTGSISITGWTEVGVTGIYQASVPNGTNTRQLWTNGLRASRAQLSAALVSTFSTGDATFVSTSGSMPTFARPTDLELGFYCGSYIMDRFSVTSATQGGGTLTLNVNSTAYGTALTYFGGQGNVVLVSIENAFELLSSSTPGCWYLNTSTNTIYYVPRAGENMATIDARIPSIEFLIQGSAASPLQNVQFTGIVFEYTGWILPTTIGFYLGNQFYSTPTGSPELPSSAVYLPNCRNVTVKRNVFRHLGGIGLAMYGACNYPTIQSNIFTDISCFSIYAGDAYINPVGGYSVVATNLYMRSNYIHDTSVEYLCGTSILTTNSAQILHNLVVNCPYYGIAIGTVYDGNLTAEFGWNQVLNACDTLSDGGSLYVFTEFCTGGTSTYHDNYLTAGAGQGYWAIPIYFDVGSTGWTLSNNVSIPTNGWWIQCESGTSVVGSGDFTETGKIISPTGASFSETPTYLTGISPAGWSAAAQSIFNLSGLDQDDSDLLNWSGAALMPPPSIYPFVSNTPNY